MDLFDGISKTRDDEECPNCGGGTLNGIVGGDRRVSDGVCQSLWKCANCGELVAMLDEDLERDCPTCGASFRLTVRQFDKIDKDSNALLVLIEAAKSAHDWFSGLQVDGVNDKEESAILASEKLHRALINIKG